MNLTCWLLMPRGILVYKFRTRFMQNNPTKRALTAFSLLFNYGRTTGNQSANQHGVTQQPSMGQHHMLPGPSFELLLYHNIPGKNNNSKTEMSVTPCSCERNGNRRMGVLQTALLFQSGCLYVLLFVFFSFLCLPLVSKKNGCLASLSCVFTASSPKFAPFSLISGQWLLSCWKGW